MSTLKIVKPSFWNLLQDGKLAAVTLAVTVYLTTVPLLIGGFGLFPLAVTAACAYLGRKYILTSFFTLAHRMVVVWAWRKADPNLQRCVLLAEHFRWRTVFWRPIKDRRPGSDIRDFLEIYGGQIILVVSRSHRVVVVTSPEAVPAAIDLAQTLSLWQEWKVLDCSKIAGAAP